MVIVCAIVLMLCMVSCARKPEKVLERFVQCWFKGKLEEAKKFVDPAFVDFIDTLAWAKPQEEMENMEENEVLLEILNVEQTSDSTRIYRCHVFIDGEKNVVDFDLIKKKNKWYININR